MTENKNQTKTQKNGEKTPKNSAKNVQKSKKRENKRILLTSLAVIAVVFTTLVAVTVTCLPNTKSNASRNTTVAKKPVLVVKPQDVTVVYGQPLPCLTCTATENGKAVESDYTAFLTKYPTDVGTYTVYVKPHENADYDVVYKTGKVTVVPRMLSLDKLTKVYDSSDEIDVQSLGFTNVAYDDEIVAYTDYVKTPSKNVGCYQVTANTVELQGDKAKNYVLPEYFTCEITQKTLSLTGAEVYDKVYDGTTKATVKNAGTLCGVESGDNVALGTLSLRFDGANSGNHDVIVENATIVGFDKQNYVLDDVETHSAVIK